MNRLPNLLASGLSAILLSGLVGCATRSKVALVVKADPATVRTKLLELSGGRTLPAASVERILPFGNPRFVIVDPAQPRQYNSIAHYTEVEVVLFRKSQSLLRARTRTHSASLNSIPFTGDLAGESAVLRLCADYIERGVKPVGRQVIPFELWQQQTRTNGLNQLPREGVPPANWTKPELKLR